MPIESNSIHPQLESPLVGSAAEAGAQMLSSLMSLTVVPLVFERSAAEFQVTCYVVFQCTEGLWHDRGALVMVHCGAEVGGATSGTYNVVYNTSCLKAISLIVARLNQLILFCR